MTQRAAIFAILAILTAAVVAADDTEPKLQSIAAIVDDAPALDGKVVYLDFWASWCKPCRTSFPWMQSMVERHHDAGLRIVTVNVDRDPESARRFIEEMQSTLPVVSDSHGKLAKQMKLEAMPTALIFDRSGVLRLRHAGFREKDIPLLETTLADLLDEGVPSTTASEDAPASPASETAP